MSQRWKVVAALVIVGAGLMLARASRAGFKSVQPVTLHLNGASGLWAKGELGDVHDSTQPEEFIGCAIDATAGAVTATCEAGAGDGTRASCTTTDPNLISALYALNGDSHLEFHWVSKQDKKNGTCTEILVKNSSTTKPKH
jgi:hypothetical protein